jgi:hypothetical protein
MRFMRVGCAAKARLVQTPVQTSRLGMDWSTQHSANLSLMSPRVDEGHSFPDKFDLAVGLEGGNTAFL